MIDKGWPDALAGFDRIPLARHLRQSLATDITAVKS